MNDSILDILAEKDYALSMTVRPSTQYGNGREFTAETRIMSGRHVNLGAFTTEPMPTPAHALRKIEEAFLTDEEQGLLQETRHVQLLGKVVYGHEIWEVSPGSWSWKIFGPSEVIYFGGGCATYKEARAEVDSRI